MTLRSANPPVPPGARPVARVILLDVTDRVLLLLAAEPGHDHTWWVMPGGGLEPGETFEEAAAREVSEETGLEVEIGPCVWTRHHIYQWQGRTASQFELFFVARTGNGAVSPSRQDSYVRGHRWWTLDEVVRSADDFAPARLAVLLSDIVRGAFPPTPIDAGV